MADQMSNWMGGPRHAPRAEISAPDVERRRPVGTFSRPAMDSDVQGTGSLLSGPERSRPGRAAGLGSLTEATGPLDLAAHEDVIEASGLGGSDDDRSWAEKLSDADEPEQEIKAQADGSLVHRKRVSGGVRETPLSAYGPDLARKVFSTKPIPGQGDGSDGSIPKPRLRGQFNGAGQLGFEPSVPDFFGKG